MIVSLLSRQISLCKNATRNVSFLCRKETIFIYFTVITFVVYEKEQNWPPQTTPHQILSEIWYKFPRWFLALSRLCPFTFSLMAWQETKNIIFINSWLYTMVIFYFFPVKSWLPSEDLIQVPLPSSKWITNVSNFKRQFASMLTVVEIQTTLASLRKLQKNYHKNNNINSLQKSHYFPPLWKEAMASSIEWDI